MADIFQPLPFPVPSEPTRCLRMGLAAKLVFLLFLFSGCATSQTHHVYLVETFVDPEAAASRVVKNERVAQTWPASKLTGKIVDVRGEVLPNATLHLTDLATGKRYGTSTQIDGTYVLELPPAHYLMEIFFIGYARLRVNEIDLAEGDWREIDGEMVPAFLKDVVPVVSERKLSDAELRETAGNNESLLKKYYRDGYGVRVTKVKDRDVFLYLDPSIDKHLKVIRL